MCTIKIISLILLAVYLFFNSVIDLFGFTPTAGISCLLGAAAVGSGILMLICVREFDCKK